MSTLIQPLHQPMKIDTVTPIQIRRNKGLETSTGFSPLRWFLFPGRAPGLVINLFIH
jgi:hypothetical protein